MAQILSSLFARLSLFFLLTLLTLGLTTLWVSHRNSRDYFLEFTQQLNSPIAMYMAENTDLIVNRQVNTEAFARLIGHVVVINPSVEVYLLDTQGKVIESVDSAHGNEVVKTTAIFVDMEPIERFLDSSSVYPIFGTNPRKPESKSIFSVAPLHTPVSIGHETEHLGFVYVVLAGERHQSLLKSISDSYSIKNMSLTLAGTLLFTLLAGITVFFLLTRRLTNLTQKASNWQNNFNAHSQTLDIPSSIPSFSTHSHAEPPIVSSRDEIDVLAATYDSMANQLLSQCQNLQASDQNRREFFANISHDLRTPLTTMQSYLETLVQRSDSLSASDRKKYLETAHKQTLRLQRLVMQLFELSKLTSGSVVLEPERFSLLELSFDCIQQFSLKASQSGVTLAVKPSRDDTQHFDVMADIGLIQRVFENLLANALRFTPAGGSITIELKREKVESVTVIVSDTGIGISEEKLQHVFSRHYPEKRIDKDTGASAGLGLSIVKNIVELHRSSVQIASMKNSGTQVMFSLPSASAD
jgi:two-component system, OmpR family, sensor kinase